MTVPIVWYDLLKKSHRGPADTERKLNVHKTFRRRPPRLPKSSVRLIYVLSLRWVFCQKGVLGNFVKITGKNLCQSLFLNKVVDLRPTTLLKKRPWNRCFPENFAFSYRAPPMADSRSDKINVFNNLPKIQFKWKFETHYFPQWSKKALTSWSNKNLWSRKSKKSCKNQK